MKDQDRNNVVDGDRNKYNYNNQTSELKLVRDYLTTHNASATMVAVALNIYRPNLTRYKFMLEDEGILVVTHRAACEETGRKVCFLSCDPITVRRLRNGS